MGTISLSFNQLKNFLVELKHYKNSTVIVKLRTGPETVTGGIRLRGMLIEN